MGNLAILYPYRNREISRLRKSFDSLTKQTSDKFEVYFVDYGSEPKLAGQVKQLCEEYGFINYRYYATQFQPWNKSKALNSVIRSLIHDFCFIADVDYIFYNEFIETCLRLIKNKKVYYFQIGYLSDLETDKFNSFREFQNYRVSTHEATGPTLIPTGILKDIRGFDEFYHCWGAEDTDLHVRMQNANKKIEFYKDRVLILHQWHPSYRSQEKDFLTSEYQIKNITALNQEHLSFAIREKLITANSSEWGKIENDKLEALGNYSKALKLTNEKNQVENFLYAYLPNLKNESLWTEISLDPFEKSWKYRLKRKLGKKVPRYYTLKQINDLVLLHLIGFYRYKAYNFKIDLEQLKLHLYIDL